jgi:hypothetical protein
MTARITAGGRVPTGTETGPGGGRASPKSFGDRSLSRCLVRSLVGGPLHPGQWRRQGDLGEFFNSLLTPWALRGQWSAFVMASF